MLKKKHTAAGQWFVQIQSQEQKQTGNGNNDKGNGNGNGNGYSFMAKRQYRFLIGQLLLLNGNGHQTGIDSRHKIETVA